MVSVRVYSGVDRGFEPLSGQSGFDNHAALIRKRKKLVTRNQDNVSAWRDMSTLGLFLSVS